MWQPSASIDDLRQRATLLRLVREFFHQRAYWEVETPLLASHGVTDVYLNNFSVKLAKGEAYLQTSPEFHMKRLLAAGSGPIFYLGKAFRDDEQGRLHNREFSLLEWYRPGFNHHQLMEEVDALLQTVLNTRPAFKITYQQAFEQVVGITPFQCSQNQLQDVLKTHALDGVLAKDEADINQAYYLLMSHVVEPHFATHPRPVFIHDFPLSQAALARCHEGVAERFEVYFKGIELANGFHELTDSFEQRRRFEGDNVLRTAQGLAVKKIDEHFLAALEEGLPPCAGVALGVDRLLMLAMNKTSLSQVLSFDALNA